MDEHGARGFRSSVVVAHPLRDERVRRDDLPVLVSRASCSRNVHLHVLVLVLVISTGRERARANRARARARSRPMPTVEA